MRANEIFEEVYSFGRRMGLDFYGVTEESLFNHLSESALSIVLSCSDKEEDKWAICQKLYELLQDNRSKTDPGDFDYDMLNKSLEHLKRTDLEVYRKAYREVGYKDVWPQP